MFDDIDRPAWWEMYCVVAESLVMTVQEPTSLSALLIRAQAADKDSCVVRDNGADLDTDSLAAAVCHLAHELCSASFTGREDGQPVLAIPSGRNLNALMVGDDLLVVAGRFGDAPAQPRTRSGWMVNVTAESLGDAGRLLGWAAMRFK